MSLFDPEEKTPELDQTLASFEAKKAELGLTKSKYLDVKDLAQQVGMQDEPKSMNKVTSKLVHPTAFSVLAFSNKGELQHLMPIFFSAGTRYALEICETIKAHVDKNGMEP